MILDLTNTVVLRGDRERSFDRFADTAEIARFAEAAGHFRSDELGGRPRFDDTRGAARRIICLREASDYLFRQAARRGVLDAAGLGKVMSAGAACLDGADEEIGTPDRPAGAGSRPLRFETALAVSALSLAGGQQWRKVRVCANCNWLFLDRSRNSSRLWCDMAVCGNRQKARRHYARRRAEATDDR